MLYIFLLLTSVHGQITGNVSVAFLVQNCANTSYSANTITNTAQWITERINFLEILSPLKLALEVYETCSELEQMKTLFNIYLSNHVGVISSEPSDKIRQFGDVLGLRTRIKRSYESDLVNAAVDFLAAVGWRVVVVVAPQEQVVEGFYSRAKTKGVCVSECYIYEDASLLTLNATNLIIFAPTTDINKFLINDTANVLLVPLDGDVPTAPPDNSYIILPSHSTPYTTTILPTPLMFEVAEPLLKFALETRHFINTKCNDTLYKINCLNLKPWFMVFPPMTPREVLRWLKLEELEGSFNYYIYKVERNDGTLAGSNMYQKPFIEVASYNMFYHNLTLLEDVDDVNDTDVCPYELIIRRPRPPWNLSLRGEAWIYALLSLSLLGVLFCLAILIFLLTAISQRRILEGNPMSTLLLLVAVMLVFLSVLPFSLQNSKVLCIVKSLSVTLSYALVFAVLLSRSIVISSAAKEVGFMSHIAGPVQSFLCLFIFGVQAALSLHLITKCSDLFTQGYGLLYIMTYNTVLLLLLLTLTPLIFKSQRNYREGKYFSFAIVLIVVVWVVWLTGFGLLEREWKELMVCLGLVATGGVCLGAIFIPRTYLMTIANERDKITSALPSLNTATSAMDIYRAHSQPIYDCVNIAAINAATVAGAAAPPSLNLQQPDLYSCPALPEDLDFDLCCDSPPDNDKVTRF